MNSRDMWISFCTISKKEINRFLRIWIQTLIAPVITISLYFIIFGNFIGSQIGPINGFSYMQFIVPGLIMMAIINNAYSNVASSFFFAKFQKSIEELLISPTPNSIILLGYTIGGLARGIIIGILVTLLSLFFTQLKIHNIFIIFIFLVLTGVLFSLAGLLNAIFAKKFDDISIVPTFILTPLTYLSGVFYSIELLPPLWQEISKLNPLVYLINGLRYGFLGISDVDINIGLAILIIFTILLFGVNLHLLNKGYNLKK